MRVVSRYYHETLYNIDKWEVVALYLVWGILRPKNILSGRGYVPPNMDKKISVMKKDG